MLHNTLVVFGHPDWQSSQVSKAWFDQIQAHLPQVKLHVLDHAHQNGQFDIAQERALVQSADKIILIYPVYWFDTPWLMQKWLEDVFTRDFYFEQKAMINKELCIAISFGGNHEMYSLGGLNLYPIEFYLLKIQGFAHKCGMRYTGHYALDSARLANIKERIVETQDQFLSWIKS